jgi:MtrB/PioB family decaheme-associated outer membrane protein
MAIARRAGAVLTAVLLGLGIASPASAQTSLFGLNAEGEIELGGRIFLGEPAQRDKAKLIEYRDLDEQPFGKLRLRFARPDGTYAVELGGSNIGQDDQEFYLTAEGPGVWKFDLGWDQIPHVYSTNARILATEPSRGVFTLPTPRPPLSAYNSGRRLDEVSNRWDTGRLALDLAPTPSLDLRLQYTYIDKHGDKPLGMAFGSPGNDFMEVLEPVDQKIHEFRIRGSWVGEGWQLQGGYTLSVFENEHTSVTADNPCFGLGGPAPNGCAGGASGAPQRGQLSLEPDNMAHTVSLAGAVNLPFWRTRIAANTSYSLRIQNQSFLPHTINPSLASSPLLTLPQQDLGGMVGTFLFDVGATSRPLQPLTLKLRYRVFNYDDMSDELEFPGHVVNDRGPVVNESRIAGRYSYTKHNADFDGRWRFGQPVALTAGVGWERWDRGEHREVPQSDEYTGKLALDVTPTDWMMARLAYRPSIRRVSEYNTFAHLAHTVVEEPTPDEQAQGQSVLLRKFDEGARDRHRVDLLLSFTPTDVISITPSFSYRNDDYKDSFFGLQKAESFSAGFDMGWTPLEWLSMGAGYVYEKIEQRQRSRNREVTGTTTFDFADFDWVTKNVDTIHTIHLSAKATLIPNRLEAGFDLSYSTATGEVQNSNPVKPTSGTAAQRANATVRPFPDLEDKLLRVEASLRYLFTSHWTFSVGYIFERFDQSDFRTDTLNPFMPGSASVWLGSDPGDYTAHILVMSVGYRF